MRTGFALVAAAVLLACTPRGSEGGECNYAGGIFSGHWFCNEGLVCNQSHQPPLCEKPRIHIVGEGCSEDLNCLEPLWCSLGPNRICSNPLLEGEPCPSGIGCAEGLTCMKPSTSDLPTCHRL